MTQLVTDEFGAPHEFPDDASSDEMNSAISQHLYGNHPVGDPIDTYVDNATDMLTFGLNKPFNALGEAALTKGGQAIKGIFTGQPSQNFGDLYDQYIAQQNNISKAQNEANPISASLGDATGFVGSMATMMPGVGTKTIAQTTPSVWNTLKTLGASARNNALISAGLGETNAVANTPGSLEDKVASAYPAGTESAAIGAAVPLVAQGILSGGKAAASPIINRLTSSDSDAAITKLAKRFAQDNNITPDQAKTILQNLGPNASLADAGGTNVQNLGKTILNTPGSGANNTTNFLLGRARSMAQRLQGAVKTGFGNNAEFNDTIANLQQAQQEQASPHYKAFYAANPNMMSPEIDRILKTPAGNSALKQAAVDMQNGRSNVAMSDPELVEQAKLAGSYQPGSGGIASGLKGETLDYTKQALDDQISAAYRAGNIRQGNQIKQLKNDLLAEMDRLDVTAKGGPNSFKPEGGSYKQARAGYSGPAQSKDALEMGRNFMNEDSQVTAKDVANLSDSDKHFFQIGAARAISDKAAANPSNTIKNIVGNDLWKQRLQAAMPTKDHYYNFLQNAQNEATMQGTKNAIMGNSSTAGQITDMPEEEGAFKMPYDLNLGNIIDASRGDLKGTAIQVGRHYLGKAMAPKPAVADQLGQMLFSDNPQQNANTIQAWQQHLSRPQPLSFSNMAAPKLNPLLGWQAGAEIGRLNGQQE